jgi:hypothetical protein
MDKKYFFTLASGLLLKNTELYIKEGSEYILASEKFTYPD